MIYMAHISSRLNYCLLLWGTLISQAETDKIKVFQNACIRILTNDRLRQPILSMFKVSKNIKFVEMEKLSLVLFMHKYKKGLLSVPIKIYSYNIQIDQTHKIFLFPSRRHVPQLYNSSFLNECLNEWSLLPYEFQSSPSMATFEKRVKIHLQIHYYLYIIMFILLFQLNCVQQVTVITIANSH